MGQEISSTISAVVILKSKTGQSLAHTEVPITSENIENFKPTSETITRATKRLEELGFNVQPSPITLTLLGKTTLFEKVFKIKLTIDRDETTGSEIVHANRELLIPDSLKDVVEKVVFSEPPEFFP